jgi:hypothetical protein
MAFAVFRLMASSNFVGCSMGKSFGCRPCKILCTNLAPCRTEAGPSAPNDTRPPISVNARVVEAAGKTIFDRHIGHRFDRQVALNDEGIGSLSHHGREGAFELIRFADHHDWLYFYACGATGQAGCC